MGAAASHPEGDQPPSQALHVLRVTPGSPASLAGIQVFFDFIVGIDGKIGGQWATDAHNLEKIVESHEGSSIILTVWSSKSRTTRNVSITPSRDWTLSSSSSSVNATNGTQPSLLGLTLRLCSPEFALDNVWHILEILEGSPAESAGLVPYGDWIVGWSGGVLSKEADFLDLVEQHVERPLRVYVYSYDFDTLREVVLVPNRKWGGEGLLGCGVGYGLLHRIPQIRGENESLVEEESGLEENNASYDEPHEESLFVPADVYPEYDASQGGTIGYDVHDVHDQQNHVQQQDHHKLDHDHNHDHDHGSHDHDHDHYHHHHHHHHHQASSSSTVLDVATFIPKLAAIPISAPIPVVPVTEQSLESPASPRRLPFSASTPPKDKPLQRRGSTPTPIDLISARRSATPDLTPPGVRRLGSPRLEDNIRRIGIGVGLGNMGDRRTSYSAHSGLMTPTTMASQNRSKLAADNDDETEDGSVSDGGTRGGSITSVD